MPESGSNSTGALEQTTQTDQAAGLIKDERELVLAVTECLSGSVIENLKREYRNKLSQMYDAQHTGTFDELMTNIVGEVDEVHHQEAIALFFEEFINFVKVNEHDDRLAQFISQIGSLFERGNLAERMGFANHFHFLAQASRIPVLAKLALRSLEYETFWAYLYSKGIPKSVLWLDVLDDAINEANPPQFEELVQSLAHLSVGRQLDAVHFCQWLADFFIATDRLRFPEFSKKILQRISDKSPSAFLQYASASALAAIDRGLESENYLMASLDVELWNSEDEAYDRGLTGPARDAFIAQEMAESDRYSAEISLVHGRLFEALSETDQTEGEMLAQRISNLPRILTAPGIPPRALQISQDYIGVYDASSTINYLAKVDSGTLPPPPETVELAFEPLNVVTQNLSFNPFQNIPSEDIPMLIQQLHRPGMRAKVEEELGITLKEMPLANQFHLLRFMAEEGTETFEQLRRALPAEGERRQPLLTAFLACAEDRRYGHKILELAERYPQQAGAVFERFYQIISITRQEEEKIKVALEANPDLKGRPNLDRLHQTMLNRGVELLKNAYDNIERIDDIDLYLAEAKRYQLKLIAFRGIFDSITSGDHPVSPQEIKQLSADTIDAESVKGGHVLTFNPSEVDSPDALQRLMRDPTNYSNPSQFGVNDYLMIVRSVEATYKGAYKPWGQYFLSQLPYHLNNPKANFILIRNEDNELVGIGRSDKRGEKDYAMGTFYVEDGYQGVGRYMGQYLEQNIPDGSRIEGVTSLSTSAAVWHIEINGYVGDQIVDEASGVPIITCSNHPGEVFKTKNKNNFSQLKIQAMGIGDFEEGTIKILQADTSVSDQLEDLAYHQELSGYLRQGYFLTRFFYGLPQVNPPAANTWIVLEKRSV